MKSKIWYINISQNSTDLIKNNFPNYSKILIKNIFSKKTNETNYKSIEDVYKYFLKNKYSFLYNQTQNQNQNLIPFSNIPISFWKTELINKIKKDFILFCIVRNPYERVIQLFTYLLNKINELDKVNDKIFKSTISSIFDNNFSVDIKNLNKFIHKIFSSNKYSYYLNGDLIPQYYYIFDDKKNQIPNDILKYENLESNFTNFIKKYDDFIDVNKLASLPILKKVDFLNINDLDKKSIELINSYFKLDFEYLNYDILNSVKLFQNIKNNDIQFENKNYNIKFKEISYEINDISPLIELKRYELIQEIKQDIKTILQDNHLQKIDVNNFLPRFIMNQYKNKSTFIDPLLPYNAEYFNQLKEDLYYLSKKKLNKKMIDSLVEKLNLKEKFNEAIIKLKNYIKTEINTRKEIKGYQIQETSDEQFYYYKILIDNESFHYVKKLIYSQFKINKKLYEKLKNNYILDDNNTSFFKELIMCLIIRYHTLESYNQQLAINPNFKEYLNNKFQIDFELFASSINFYYTNYCSFFYDIEKYFQSKGNFDFIDIKKGFYIANPPFDNDIMSNMSNILIHSLKKTNEPLSILLTVPKWDDPEYGGFECLELLEKSGFITFKKVIPKNKACFYDYYLDKYIWPTSIFVIIIQNKKGMEEHFIDEDFKTNIEYYFNLNKKDNHSIIDINKNNKNNKNNNKIGGNAKFDNYIRKFIYNKTNDNKEIVIDKKDFISHIIEYPKKIKINKNLIIKVNAHDFKENFVKKYYQYISLKNKNLLLGQDYNIIKNKTYINIKKFDDKKNTQIMTKKKDLISLYTYNILHLYFNKDTNFDDIGIIDITFSCGNFIFIQDRLNKYYEEISNFLIERDIFTKNNIDIIYNPLYNKTVKKIDYVDYNAFFEDFMSQIKTKKNFVIMNGTLEYFELKAISYYTEQISYILFFSEIYYLLNIIKKEGSFISYSYTFCSKINQHLLKILNKYFEKIILHKEKKIKGNFMYLIGQNFKGISEHDLHLFKSLYENIFKFYKSLIVFGENLNIFDKKIRKEKNIIKFIKNFQTNNFIHNLFDLKENKEYQEYNKIFDEEINKFHKQFFKLNV